MRRLRNALLAALLAVLMPVGLAACGGDDDDGVTPDETEGNIPTDDEVGETGDEGDNLGGEAED